MNSSNLWFTKWSKLASLPTLASTESDLAYLFQTFRTAGTEAAALFDGILRGDEVVRRLEELYRVSASSYMDGDVYFVIRNAPPLGLESKVLARAHLDIMSVIAKKRGDDEVSDLLTGTRIEWANHSDETKPSPTDDTPLGWVFDLVSDFLMESADKESPLVLLRDAAYSIANDLYVAAYILWPLYAGSCDLMDPFRPYFELWTKGVAIRYLTEDRCVLALK